MQRREFLRRYFLKFTAAVVLVGLIVYTVYHAIGADAGSLMTTPAQTVTDTQILGAQAYLFRDETVLHSEAEGLIYDLCQSGEKVSNGALLAEIKTDYKGDARVEAQRTLDRLCRVIRVLENSETGAGEPLSNAQGYDKEAEAAYFAIKRAIASGDYSAVTEKEDEMLISYCRYLSLTGNRAEIEATLASARAERDRLLAGASTPLYNTVSSGYFYDRSYVDGGESLFTTEALEGLTPASFDALCAQYETVEKSGFYAGKMVYRHDWRLALSVDDVGGLPIEVGDALRVIFPENGDLALRLTCESIAADSGGRAVIVLRCDDTPRGFAYLREQHIEIEIGTTEGYYIPEQALTVQDECEGVYILEGSTVYFRRINVLYRGEGYVIAEVRTPAESGYLNYNDIIVTSGGDLYDGRVFQ